MFDNSQRGGGGGVRVVRHGFLHVIHLFRNRVFDCARTEQSSQYNQYVVDLTPEANASILGAENLLLHVEVPNRTANAGIKVVLDRKMFDGQYTVDDQDLLAWSSSTGPQVGTEMSTRSKIGIHNRISVLTRVTTGGTGAHYVEASAVLLARQWS